jgi:hypothetical protein
MRGGPWIPLVLYLEAMVTTIMSIGMPWIEAPGELDPDGWRRQHIVSMLGHWGWLLATIAAMVLIGWLIYWIILDLQHRWRMPGAELRAIAIASAGFAAAGLCCTAFMTYLAYDRAGRWVAASVMEQPATPLEHATVTAAPWLLMAGLASIVVAGLVLQRRVNADRQRGLAG